MFFGDSKLTFVDDEKYISGELPLCGITRNKLAFCIRLKYPAHLKSRTPLFAEEVTESVASCSMRQEDAM